MTERAGDFDDIARNIAETIDAILVEERSRDRRIELIRHSVRRALGIGYRAAKHVRADGR